MQNLANAFNGQNIDENLQATLNEVFFDVLKGLNSLDLDVNSTASDIVSAILADPGYVCGVAAWKESVDLYTLSWSSVSSLRL